MTSPPPRPERPDIPRRILRAILKRTGTTIGSRFLDIGCGEGTVCGLLNTLGIDATGCDRPEQVDQAKTQHPLCNFYAIGPNERPPLRRGSFDLVLIRESSFFEGSLLSGTTLNRTAELADLLRPGGSVVIAQCVVDSSAHTPACLQSHLETFAAAQATTLDEGLWIDGGWRRWLKGQRLRSVRMAFGQLGGLNAVDLRRAAHQGGGPTCCLAAAEYRRPRVAA